MSNRLQKVTSLDVGGNHWTPSMIQSFFISAWLKLFPRLEDLDMRDNKILSAGTRALLPALGKYCGKTLHSLCLSENIIKDTGVIALTQSHLPYLRSLELVSNFITVQGARELASYIQYAEHQLETLTLDYNPLGDEGVEALVQALRASTSSMRRLSLGDCGLGDASCTALSELLFDSDCRLAYLNLSVNRITFRGVSKLIPKGNSISNTLKHLDLGGNPLKDRGVLELLKQSIRFRFLQTLDLTCVSMTEKGASKMLSRFSDPTFRTRLLTIHIDGNFISDQLGLSLVQAFKDQSRKSEVKHSNIFHVFFDASYVKVALPLALVIILIYSFYGKTYTSLRNNL